jgi:hypothetical protein
MVVLSNTVTSVNRSSSGASARSALTTTPQALRNNASKNDTSRGE